ncbi:MAG: glycosyltransferase family 39 protein, partial [Candidatus Hydrogenedentes bacterium]|nr:glycosyltransferase family 39 protein [Candidatus Hydrogenedentota bacterium]
VKNRTLMPTHFSYPTLFSYLSTVPTGIGAAALYMQGTIPSPMQISSLARLDSVLPYLPARLTSTAFALATVLLLFKIGERFYDRRTGLIAAAFLALSTFHIHRSGYALPDTTMVFFAACSLLFSLSALKTKTVRDFVLAGCFAGLTTATKYNGALMIIPILSAHIFHLYDEKRYLVPKAWVNSRIMYSGLAFICAFLIACPGWLLIPGVFWEKLLHERALAATGHLGSFGIAYFQYLTLAWDWEKTTVVLVVIGLIHATFRHTRQDAVLLSLVLLSFLYIGSWEKKYLRYLLFLYPALSLLSARLLSEVLARVNKRAVNFITPLVIITTFTWPMCSAVMYACQQIPADNRWIAQRWIQDNIPEESRIVVDWAYLPRLITEEEKRQMLTGRDKEFFETRLRNVNTYELIPLEYDRTWLGAVQADYLITSGGCFDRFFESSPPPPNNPLFKEHSKRKGTYSALLRQEEEIGWKLLKRFRTGKGHHVLIYKRLGEKNLNNMRPASHRVDQSESHNPGALMTLVRQLQRKPGRT